MPVELSSFPIYGSQVKLQHFSREQIDARYVGWLNDPQIVRYSNQRFFKHSTESCLKYLQSFEESENIFASVLRIDDNVMIGTMTAYFNRHHGTVDVGIMIGENTTWGSGFGQDAWNTMLNALRCSPSIRKITAGTLDCNTGMLKLMQRSGMHLEAVRKQQEIVEGIPRDVHHYAQFNDS